MEEKIHLILKIKFSYDTRITIDWVLTHSIFFKLVLNYLLSKMFKFIITNKSIEFIIKNKSIKYII